MFTLVRRLLYDSGMVRNADPTDAIIAELGGPDVSTAVGSRVKKFSSGEHKLAVKVVESALEDASLPEDCILRRDARSWLRDSSRLYSARGCVEALGVDYDAAIAKLELKWSAAQ